jgi:cyclase
MGLATRIIPTLLFRGDKLVKGTKFDPWRVVGHVEQAAKIYAARGTDEVILLDVAARDHGPDFDLVRRISRDFFTPLTVGGGCASVEAARELLLAGADKIAIGRAAVHDRVLVSLSARKFGSQAICVAVNVKGEGLLEAPDLDPVTYARRLEAEGAGEILLTSVDREGLMVGYDLDLIQDVARAVNIPVIAHGGCSSYRDMAEAIRVGAHAVAAGALFQFTDCTPRSAATYLQKNGYEVRI